MKQLRRKLLIIIITALAFVVALIIFIVFHYHPMGLMHIRSDKCTAQDWATNNCVPPGRCTPPGNPMEATVDCALKNYPHKYMVAI